MFSLNVYQFVSGTLPDERYGAKPPPLEVFNFDILTTKYVKFTMISKEISTIKFALTILGVLHTPINRGDPY